MQVYFRGSRGGFGGVNALPLNMLINQSNVLLPEVSIHFGRGGSGFSAMAL
ncbi:hypothetical protein [Lacticaseibacillus nasuensis]|uniref:Uncharacterized protein n=1 Tax=Lacticaseibacillus nasuensis JCM 17158 TaxID=1291734 RepID=A0A0R1JMM6_9LACO|nr:hypothetical protein [Lacticaseibacillus nasuensis]KRK72559.1 hypothetical protein FD02_GL001532 [Lacticaseibacillus nasuensis JCM 17158]